GVKAVELYTPNPVSPSDAIDASNASTLISGLEALGITVRSGSTTFQSGVPAIGRDICTQRMSVRVPHPPGHGGTRTVRADADDLDGHNSRTSWFNLDCDPNPATCGNGVLELGD